MRLLLGTHQPSWLARTRLPLFVSFSRLSTYQRPPRAIGNWALDSGAFTELYRHREWRWSAEQYASDVRRFSQEAGRLEWASIQDWICTPAVLRKTGLSVSLHQENTVRSLLQLRRFAPDVNWLPVLQGWDLQSYFAHAKMYAGAGVSLQHEMLVGVGSVASRQRDPMLPELFRELHQLGLRLHAFGLSAQGLRRVHQYLCSADSMVWSYIARRRKIKHRKCCANHSICNNCLMFAVSWRRNLLAELHE